MKSLLPIVKNHRGLIGTLFLIVSALILLGYFGINIETVVSSPVVKENLLYAWDLVWNAGVALWNWLLAFTTQTIFGKI
jgi:hypothetical protein